MPAPAGARGLAYLTDGGIARAIGGERRDNIAAGTPADNIDAVSLVERLAETLGAVHPDTFDAVRFAEIALGDQADG